MKKKDSDLPETEQALKLYIFHAEKEIKSFDSKRKFFERKIEACQKKLNIYKGGQHEQAVNPQPQGQSSVGTTQTSIQQPGKISKKPTEGQVFKNKKHASWDNYNRRLDAGLLEPDA